MFRFHTPSALYLLFLIPLLVFFFLTARRARRHALQEFGELALIRKLFRAVSEQRQIARFGLALLGTIFLVIALARPQFGSRLETVERKGQDVVIALDLSKSMLAQDIRPNRLQKSKFAISQFIDLLDGDRIGLVGFAGEAFIQCPLTLDYGAAKLFLNAMAPDIMPVPGTALSEAVSKSLELLESSESKQKVLILITDGEDHGEGIDEVASKAADQGVVIYAIGVGSPQGTPIPLLDSQGHNQGFKKDDQGNVVITRLNDAPLRTLAEQTQGKFFIATPGGSELEEIAKQIAGFGNSTLASKQFVQYEEQYHWFGLLALLLLVTEALLPEARKLKRDWKGRFQ